MKKYIAVLIGLCLEILGADFPETNSHFHDCSDSTKASIRQDVQNLPQEKAIEKLCDLYYTQGNLVFALSVASDLNFRQDLMEALKQKKTEKMLWILLDNEALAASYNDTPLSLKSLVQQALLIAHKDPKPFDEFAEWGKMYHEELSDLILKELPNVLPNTSSAFKQSCVCFLNDVTKPFQEKVFWLLVPFMTDPEKKFIQDLFYDSGRYLRNQSDDFFNRFYRQLRDQNAFHAIHKLWLFLKDKKKDDLLQKMVSQEKEVSLERIPLIPYLPYPTQRLFLSTLLFDEHPPIEQQITLLNTLIFPENIEVPEEELALFKETFEEKATDSPLKTYGLHLFDIALSETSHECCIAKQELIAFLKKEENSAFKAPYRATDLYNAFYKSLCKNRVIPLQRTLDKIQVDTNGTLYGIDHATLYCCNGETGYANWKYEFPYASTERIVTSPHELYVLKDHTVHIFDKVTGEYLGKMLGEIGDISLTQDGHLFAIHLQWWQNHYEQSLTCHNVVTGQKRHLLSGQGWGKLSSQGNICSIDDTIFYKKSGKSFVYAPATPFWTAIKDLFICDNENALLLRDTKTKKETNVRLDGSPLVAKPMPNPTQDKLFVATKKFLYLISFAPETFEQKLWKIPNKYGRDFKISQDGQLIYALYSSYDFSLLDLNTGAQIENRRLNFAANLIAPANHGKVYVRINRLPEIL